MTLTLSHIDALIVLCLKGNQLAQLEVYNRYHHAMFNVAYRIVKDRALAEDAMQEAFITAFEKLSRYKGDAKFGAWLKRIVINNSLAKYKKQGRFTDVPLEDIKEDTIEDSNGHTDEFSKVKARQVLDGLNLLKSNYRQVLSLYYIEGYDYDEIGDIMNLSYANCRTLISRAKMSLRKKLL